MWFLRVFVAAGCTPIIMYASVLHDANNVSLSCCHWPQTTGETPAYISLSLSLHCSLLPCTSTSRLALAFACHPSIPSALPAAATLTIAGNMPAAVFSFNCPQKMGLCSSSHPACPACWIRPNSTLALHRSPSSSPSFLQPSSANAKHTNGRLVF